MPPVGLALAEPSRHWKQLSLVVVMLAEMVGQMNGSMMAESMALQPFWSVMVSVYVPGARFRMVVVVSPLDQAKE